MSKFSKGDKVALLSSWDNKGAVRIRRAVVHSCGKQVMRLQDEAGKMFKVAFRPEHNVMVKFNGIRVIADADNAALESEALADGARVIALNIAYCNERIASAHPAYNMEAIERNQPFPIDLSPGSNERPRQWFVLTRNSSRSAFNGYRETWSDFSLIACRVCGAHWRTKSTFVSKLSNSEYFPERHEPRVEPIS
jgi:hypothetical protein